MQTLAAYQALDSCNTSRFPSFSPQLMHNSPFEELEYGFLFTPWRLFTSTTPVSIHAIDEHPFKTDLCEWT